MLGRTHLSFPLLTYETNRRPFVCVSGLIRYESKSVKSLGLLIKILKKTVLKLCVWHKQFIVLYIVLSVCFPFPLSRMHYSMFRL